MRLALPVTLLALTTLLLPAGAVNAATDPGSLANGAVPDWSGLFQPMQDDVGLVIAAMSDTASAVAQHTLEGAELLQGSFEEGRAIGLGLGNQFTAGFAACPSAAVLPTEIPTSFSVYALPDQAGAAAAAAQGWTADPAGIAQAQAGCYQAPDLGPLPGL